MKAFKIAIGTVTYNNTQSELLRFTKSLTIASAELKNSFPGSATCLYVEDNGKPSTMRTLFPDAQIVHNAQNLGYAKSMSRMIDKVFEDTESDYFLCANPDGAFHPNCIVELIRNINTFPSDLIEAIQFPQEHPKRYDPKTNVTEWASGCCLLISRHLYEEIGSFDPHFFMYMEDVDYSWRVRAAGRQVRICPEAKFSHPILANKKDSEKYYFESGRYLSHKWKDADFKNWCERKLIDLEYYPDKRSLPKLPEGTGIILSKKMKEIRNFKFEFRFCESRW